MTFVRGHYRRNGWGHTTVRSHYRSRSKKPRLNFFYANKGTFIAGGLSKRHGPYLTAGYRDGPFKVKTSIGLEGHKVSGSVKPTRNTEVGVTRNLTFNRTSYNLRYKKRKVDL